MKTFLKLAKLSTALFPGKDKQSKQRILRGSLSRNIELSGKS